MTSPIAPATAAHARIHLAPDRRLKLPALIGIIFFNTCGGAFALEPLIGAVGPGLAVALILITPLVWSLPMALMSAELTTLMPEQGGFYVWVREALGPFWAVQEAWWSIIASLVVIAGFPVLFVTYLTYFLPALNPSADAPHSLSGPLLRWLIAALVVAAAMVLNLRGARDVGRSSKACSVAVVGVFILMILVWLKKTAAPGAALEIIAADLHSHREGALLLGLSFIVYNYSGWDSISTFAAEVDEPQHNYPRGIVIGLVVVVLSYLLPVLAGVSVTSDPAIWSADAGWPVIAKLIGGNWLGSLMAAVALVSMWSLVNAMLLYVSRLPFVMACDGWLPQAFARVPPDTAVPTLAVVCLCVITAVFTGLSFGGLAVIQCLLYGFALLLEFLSLIILRVRHPDAPRSFRVPGRWWGVAYVCLTPMAFMTLVATVTLRDWRSYQGQLLVVGGIVGCGGALYFLRRGIAATLAGPPVLESAATRPPWERVP